MLRRRAWELADQLGWASTYDAEYVALTQLQADAFVTLDAELARFDRDADPSVIGEGRYRTGLGLYLIEQRLEDDDHDNA